MSSSSDPDMYIVLPAGVLDSSHATDSIILAGWVLDTPLDSEIVRTAWTRLLTAWPLLAARLNHDKTSDAWTYRIPTKPTIRNAFGSLQISAPIRTHYRYAQPSETITITPKENPHHLYCPYGPKSVDDLLDEAQDRPLVHLHMTAFEDGTLLGLSIPHILCDGHGVLAIMHSLCDIVNGGPPPSPLDMRDPFLSYAPTSDSNDAVGAEDVPAPPQWRVLSTLQTFVFMFRILWNSFWNGEIQNKDIYFPKSAVVDIKTKAMADIRHAHGNDTNLYISSSDAVLAFLLQCAHPPTLSRTPLTVFYTANMRPYLSTSLSIPWLRNTVLMPITAPLPLSTLSKMPLGLLALHIRRTLQETHDEKYRETWLRWRIRHGENEPKLFFNPYLGTGDVVTNWREMHMMGLDFSGAAVARGTAIVPTLQSSSTESDWEEAGSSSSTTLADPRKQVASPVRCLYAWGNGLQSYALNHWFGLWADDPSGGIWTSAFLPSSVWNRRQGFGGLLTA